MSQHTLRSVAGASAGIYRPIEDSPLHPAVRVGVDRFRKFVSIELCRRQVVDPDVVLLLVLVHSFLCCFQGAVVTILFVTENVDNVTVLTHTRSPLLIAASRDFSLRLARSLSQSKPCSMAASVKDRKRVGLRPITA